MAAIKVRLYGCDTSSFSLTAVVVVVAWDLAALCDSISVYIGPFPREREKEEKG